MALEGQTCISFTHSLTVINYLQTGTASLYRDDVDMRSPCVNSILNQLLNDRSWTLNNFACGNLVGYGIGKKMDEIQGSE